MTSPQTIAGIRSPEALFMSVLKGGGSPYDGYRELRETAPAFMSGRGELVLSRFADCDTALRDRRLGKGRPNPQRVAAAIATVGESAATAWFSHNMLFSDPPVHTRLRRLVRAALTVRDIENLREGITAAARRRLGALGEAGGGDFVAALATPLPIEVIEDLLGVPEVDRPYVTPLAQDTAALLQPFASDEAVGRAFASRGKLSVYFTGLLPDKRRSPSDDLLSRLVGHPEEDRLSTDETIAAAILLFAAGFETTSSMLGNGLVSLLRNPDQLALLRRQPEYLPRAVDEVLRYDPPAQFDRRAVLEPTEIAGIALEPGQFVVTIIGAANRDPERFTEPDRFDVTRDEGGHLSFAAGTHFCLGSQIAMMQGQAVLGGLLSMFQEIELSGEVGYRPGLDLYGPVSLPVTLRP